jgi:hypothetical protein
MTILRGMIGAHYGHLVAKPGIGQPVGQTPKGRS